MKYIKTFETFDFSQTLPIASKADLSLYFHCDECNALWKSLEDNDTCKFCKSDEVEELSKDEWYESVGDRLDEDEIENLESQRTEEEDTLMDLYKIRKENVN